MIKITRFGLLWWPFIHRDQASKREHKIMQNDAKMHHKSARNDHEKNIDSDVTMLKNARRRPSCEPAWKRVHFCRYRVTLLKKRISKSSKVIENLSQMPAARRANSECIVYIRTQKGVFVLHVHIVYVRVFKYYWVSLRSVSKIILAVLTHNVYNEDGRRCISGSFRSRRSIVRGPGASQRKAQGWAATPARNRKHMAQHPHRRQQRFFRCMRNSQGSGQDVRGQKN